MHPFRRVMRFVLWLILAVSALITTLAFFFARQVVRPPRQPLWATPDDVGLPYEDVQFPAREDGVRLSGWFIPAEQPSAPTLLLVHGWPWNRLGEAAEGGMASLTGASPVDLLRLAHALHRAGYSLLLFDLRNHGESASKGTVTFGHQEAYDVLGALDYLVTRPDVDAQRIGAVGFSMGGNAVLYSLPQTEMLAAAVVIQPTSPDIFARRFSQHLFGPLGGPVLAVAKQMITLSSGFRLGSVDPRFVVPGGGSAPVLFVQGQGDPWGSVTNVAEMAQSYPTAVDLLLIDTNDRYSGYQYIVDHPELLDSFFSDYLN
jgi:uncharacterized protein